MSRGRLTLFLKMATALAAAGVTVGVSLYSAKLWTPTKGLLLWLLVAGAGVTLLASIIAAVREYLAPAAAQRRERAAQLLRVTFFDIWRATRVDPLELGIAAYEVRRQPLNVWPFARGLRRLYRDRARNRLNTSGVKWAPGKGVMGLAVKRAEFVGLDVAAAWAHLDQATEADWNAEPAEVRLGLEYREFKRLKGKHGSVVAMPIISDDTAKVVGCVVVDGPSGSSSKLEAMTVQRLLGDTSVSIYRSVIRPPR